MPVRLNHVDDKALEVEQSLTDGVGLPRALQDQGAVMLSPGGQAIFDLPRSELARIPPHFAPSSLVGVRPAGG